MKDVVFYPVMLVIALASGVEVVDALRPDRVRLETTRLEFKDGKFIQEHVVTGVQQLRAEWTATIDREGEILCSGGGVAPYRSGAKPPMSPNVWTGASCPADISGSTASATWEWVDGDNVRRRASATIEID